MERKEITFLNAKSFEVKSNMNCKFEYMVYTLTCKNCGECFEPTIIRINLSSYFPNLLFGTKITEMET